MLNKHPGIYNALALFFTCAAGGIAGALVLHFGGDQGYALSITALVGYGFGRFLMPLR